MKKAKQAYLHSLLALLVCISMFVGSTFAWFTDSVSSVNNIITSGNLDLEMYWTDDLATGTWYNVEDPQYNTIFSYDNWEPGYTDVKYIKIVNKGSLAFKYQLAFTPVGEVGKLAEVINVYYGTDVDELQDRTDVSGLTSLGFLKNIMNGSATAAGVLLPVGQTNPEAATGEVIVTVAMSMLTTAGNEYQLQTAGDFTVTAMATQVENEFDSFGDDYDEDSEWPQILTPSKGETAVTPVNGVLENEVSIAAGSVSATVPAGVAVEDGVEKLTLTTTPLEKSTSDVTPSNGEILMPIDVHIEGVADSNTTPIIIDLGAVLPKYLNMGNYSLFHVEDGVTNQMTLVASKADLVNHNDYTYDSATGNVSVALASFSEICILQPGDNTYNVWNGGIDVSWYDKDATSYTIYNADQLNGLSYIVSGQTKLITLDNQEGVDLGFSAADSFAGKTVTLARDIDFDGENGINRGYVWYPIGMRATNIGGNGASTTEVWYDWGGWFEGTFDGNGHTVKGIYQRTWDMDGNYDAGYYKRGMGLFAGIRNGTVKNLTIEGFQSDGEFTPTGCIAAFAEGNPTFENIRITDCNPRVYNTGNGGLVGWDNGGDTADEASHFTFKNITVDATNKISALWGSWDVACGGILGYLGAHSKADFINCNLSATIDVFNDVCANYQYYWYRYAGMFIGTVDRTTKIDGYTAIDLNGITATNCKVNFGERHEYYYCEFVKNSLASYTHDHQFSRIEHKDLKWTDTNGDGYVQEAEAGSVTGCTHDHVTPGYESKDINGDGEIDSDVLLENNQAIYLPFRQLFGGYAWGVRGMSLDRYVDAQGKPILDISIEGSEPKFGLNSEWLKAEELLKPELDNEYTTLGVVYGKPVTVGNYFKALGNANNLINNSGVHVSVTAVAVQKKDGTVVKTDAELAKVQLTSEYTAANAWTDSTFEISCANIDDYMNVWVAVTIQDYANCTPYTFRGVLSEGSLDNDIVNPWF